MARTGSNLSTVIWTVVALLVLALGIPVVVFGPTIYREGKKMAGPIMDLARLEDETTALIAELPFAPPADGLVAEDRLVVFLRIREALISHYEEWSEVTRVVEAEKPDSWEGATEVLAVTRDVMKAQTEVLRTHGMSPLELRWLERRVYEEWLPAIERYTGVPPAVADQLREVTQEDLRFLDDLRHRHGSSPALDEWARRLNARLGSVEGPEPAAIPGMAQDNHRLLWRYRAEIEACKIDSAHSLHVRFRELDSQYPAIVGKT